MTKREGGLTAGRRLGIRLVVSPLALGIVVALLWLHGATGRPWSTDLLLVLLGAGGAAELARMFREGGVPVDVRFSVLATAVVAGAGFFAPDDAGLRMELRAVLPLGFLFLLLLLRATDLVRESAAGLAATMLPVLYVGVPLSLAHDIGPAASVPRWLVYVLVVAKASDMGGWLVGKPFGKHKLVPSISPKKSWEGLFGGLFLSAVAAVFLPAVLGIAAADWSWPVRVAYGLLLGGVSVLAGFTQSGWKRRFGVKDSSTLIPEVGGILDMVDSMLFAVPAAWLWFRLFPEMF